MIQLLSFKATVSQLGFFNDFPTVITVRRIRQSKIMPFQQGNSKLIKNLVDKVFSLVFVEEKTKL